MEIACTGKNQRPNPLYENSSSSSKKYQRKDEEDHFESHRAIATHSGHQLFGSRDGTLNCILCAQNIRLQDSWRIELELLQLLNIFVKDSISADKISIVCASTSCMEVLFGIARQPSWFGKCLMAALALLGLQTHTVCSPI